MIKDKYSSLEEWYFDKKSKGEDLSDIQFSHLLEFLDFCLKSEELENGKKIYYLEDRQHANLGNIEQDIFYYADEFSDNIMYSNNDEKRGWCFIKNSIVSRLESYMYDYFERDS